MTLNTTTRQPLAPPPVTDTGGDMGMVALVAMLTACSSEDVLLDEPNAKNEITFNVTTNRASRAVQIFDSSTKPAYFRYSAWEKGGNSNHNQEYAYQDLVKWDNNAWIIQDGLRYWPNHGEKIDFYAWSCGASSSSNGKDTPHAAFEWENNNVPRLDMELSDNARDQVDIIVASALNQKKETTINNTPKEQSITLNFKHILSEIVFKAQNKSNKLHIRINSVSFANLPYSGVFKYTTAEASNDVPTTTPDTPGSWTLARPNSKKIFKAEIGSLSETGSLIEGSQDIYWKDGTYMRVNEINNPVDLTNQDIANSAFMLFPCNDDGITEDTDKRYTWGTTITDTDWSTKPYIIVSCLVWNVARPNMLTEDENPDEYSTTDGWNENSDNLILGEKSNEVYTYANVCIPVNLDWHMGNRYTYILSFGTGNAGYINDGKGNFKPAIVPMDYNVTVTDWSEPQNDEKNENDRYPEDPIVAD